MLMEDYPIPQPELEATPLSVRKLLQALLEEKQEGDALKKQLTAKLKQQYFPGSTFVGPFEKHGFVHAMLGDQWLWKYRHLVKGAVLDMSTPVYWHSFLKEQPAVTQWLISDLSNPVVQNLGYSSKADVVGDFCAVPPPLAEKSLDTILCISILEHCEEPITMARNLAGMLRPNGVVFFMTPYAYVDGHLTPDNWRIGRDGYRLLARKAGLEIIAEGDFVDLGKYFMLEFGFSAEATNWHRGVPFNNWMIARRP